MVKRINKIMLAREVEEFAKNHKWKFTSAEFIDYLRSKGIDLSRREEVKIRHILASWFSSEKIDLIEVDSETGKVYERRVNLYKVG